MKPKRLPRNSSASSTIFVEIFRLGIVVIGALIGYAVGDHGVANANSGLYGLVVGAAVAYVLGGVIGRLADRGLQQTVWLLRRTPAGEVFSAALIATTGIVIGVVISAPLILLDRSSLTIAISATVTWTVGSLGWRIGAVKGRQIIQAAGLTRILLPEDLGPEERHALLVDSSALMDRYVLALGQVGLLPGGVVVPQFVLDHLQTLTTSADPVISRRARRGLESLPALRELGVDVIVTTQEVPEGLNELDRLMAVARRTGLRIGTCSTEVVDTAEQWQLDAIDLSQINRVLGPEHVTGEHLAVELVRSGRQARQAVGYLDSGDMVVVNDALHLVGTGPVDLIVLSTRPTSQGLMVFAQLDPNTTPTTQHLTRTLNADS